MSAPKPQTPTWRAFEKIGKLETFSYSLGDAGFNLYWAPLSAFLMIYLTDVAGIGMATVATLVTVMRLSGALADPVFAAIADRTQTQYGRYRPYFLWLCVPLAASGILAFSTAGIPEDSKVAAVYVSMIILYLVYTAIMVPYNALSGVMTCDPAQRESIMSIRFALAFLTGVAITWITPKLIAFTGVGQDALGWQFAMTIYGVLAVIIFVNLFLNTRERFDTLSRPGINAFQDIADLLRNGPWRVLAALGFVVMIATALHSGASAYYIKYFAERPDLLTAFAMCLGLGLAAGSALSSWLAALTTRKLAIAGALVLVALTSIGFSVLPQGQTGAMFAVQAVFGAALGVVSTLTFAMYAQTADINVTKTGRRATAMTYSAIMSVKKVGAAGAAAFIGWALSAEGFKANTAPSAGLLDNIRLLMGPVPAVMALCGAGLICLYDFAGAHADRPRSGLMPAE